MLYIIIIIALFGLYYYIIHTSHKQPTIDDDVTNNNNNNKIKSILKKHTTKKYKQIKKHKKNLVYLSISINGKKVGMIVIKLFNKITPITCKNFLVLCKTKKYKNSCFHRIIKDFMIQGGDYTNHNGSGGMSIYGHKFKDENFIVKHDKPYLLSMANSGANTNGSQFFITTIECPHLDNKHVVFGCVIKGFHIIDKLNSITTDANDKPIYNVVICDCGILK
jgi:peptidyl-prolyl isomerase D